MPAEIIHVINQAELRSLLHSQRGGIARDIFRRGKRVEGVAKRRISVDTGRGRSSLTTRLIVYRGNPAAEVGSNVKYLVYLHEGHGVIRPKRGKYLVFRPRGSKITVFARQVRAVKGRPFLREALPAARG